MDLPGHQPAWAPGMSQVIEAGEAYTLTDNEGKELELIGKLDKQTIAFLRAFDIWSGLERKLGANVNVTAAARATMFHEWGKLGNHVRDELI